MRDGHVNAGWCEGSAKTGGEPGGEEVLLQSCAGMPRLSAIRIADDTPTDQLLESVVHALQQEGRRVAGFIQRKGRIDSSGHAEMVLEDIASGRRVCISQPLGRGSRGCRLDPGAVAGIAGRFLETVEYRPDLLVLNRFGKGEAEGQGFRSVLEKACILGIPVLTSVKQAYLDAWQDFGGNWVTLLPPVREKVLGWSRAAINQPDTGPDVIGNPAGAGWSRAGKHL